jgi:hypothetical protein
MQLNVANMQIKVTNKQAKDLRLPNDDSHDRSIHDIGLLNIRQRKLWPVQLFLVGQIRAAV